MTETTNRFHDRDEAGPEIQELRVLHDKMDRAVLDAYGWTDIKPTCEFLLDYEEDEEEEEGGTRRKKKPWRYRWPDDVRDEVLARLMALNAERYAEEQRIGVDKQLVAAAAQSADKADTKPAAKKKATAKNKATPDPSPGLFDSGATRGATDD